MLGSQRAESIRRRRQVGRGMAFAAARCGFQRSQWKRTPRPVQGADGFPYHGGVDPELDMKRDWDARAAERAEYYIASSHFGSEQEFDESGRRDVGYLFLDLEHLLSPASVALDIGCGIGRMDRHVAPRVGHLHGIDVSREMVVRARRRLAELDNVTFHEGDGWTLSPIERASIDLVFSHIVFQHAPREVTKSYFREVARVLRPGGHFVFQMPEKGDNTPPDPPRHDTWEMRFWTCEQLREALEPHGLEILEHRRFEVGEPGQRFFQLRTLALRTE